MPDSFFGKMRNVWNVLANAEQSPLRYKDAGYSSAFKPDRVRLRMGGGDRSIVAAIYNRIAIDVASADIHHVEIDENGRYVKTIDSTLESCLSLAANKDQTGRNLIQDIVMSMFDEGCVAVVPVDTDSNPDKGSYDILSLRTAHILEWYPDHIRVRLYDDRSGMNKEIMLEKSLCAIIENPFYAVMNEPNSTLQRLIRKLNLLDMVDEQTSSGKLDLIIQLPYVIKTQARREEAEKRRKMIEQQLTGSAYGIAYTDGTEKITQLNRAVENNLLAQIESLTQQLFNQLGLTQDVFNGTADEATMLNYFNRSIEPCLTAIVNTFKWKFLTKTARTQKQSILFFRDSFKLVPVANLADIADKFTRNEILSPNEVRAIVGYKPSTDPAADELRNRNISQAKEDVEEADAKAKELDDEVKEAEDTDELEELEE